MPQPAVAPAASSPPPLSKEEEDKKAAAIKAAKAKAKKKAEEANKAANSDGSSIPFPVRHRRPRSDRPPDALAEGPRRV